MNIVDSIKSIFPKYKQQLLFLRERKKLFDSSATFDHNKENEIVEQETSLASESILSSTPKNTQMSFDIEESSISATSIQEIDIVKVFIIRQLSFTLNMISRPNLDLHLNCMNSAASSGICTFLFNLDLFLVTEKQAWRNTIYILMLIYFNRIEYENKVSCVACNASIILNLFLIGSLHKIR